MLVGFCQSLIRFLESVEIDEIAQKIVPSSSDPWIDGEGFPAGFDGRVEVSKKALGSPKIHHIRRIQWIRLYSEFLGGAGLLHVAKGQLIVDPLNIESLALAYIFG